MATPPGIPWIEQDLVDNLGKDVLGSGRSAAELLDIYFAEFKERRTSDRRKDKVGFAGQFFDEISLSRVDEGLIPGERDLTAVSYLSIKVDGEMYASLRAVASKVAEALTRVPGLGRESEIWDCPQSWFAKGSGLLDALDIVRTLDKFGETTSRKVMSAMFPHLLPVRDSVVERVMASTAGVGWWTSWRGICGTSLKSHLATVRHQAVDANPRIPGNLSLLRVADIAIWTAEHIKSKSNGAAAGR